MPPTSLTVNLEASTEDCNTSIGEGQDSKGVTITAVGEEPKVCSTSTELSPAVIVPIPAAVATEGEGSRFINIFPYHNAMSNKL